MFPTLLYVIAERVSPAVRRWKSGRPIAKMHSGAAVWTCAICGESVGGLSETANHLGEHGVYSLSVDTWSCEIRTGYRGEILPVRKKDQTGQIPVKDLRS